MGIQASNAASPHQPNILNLPRLAASLAIDSEGPVSTVNVMK